MDTKVNRTVVLLSIRPIYAERLLNKTKSVELRKTKFRKDVECVVIYSTAPIQKIVGYFTVAQIIVDSPSVIWSKYHQMSGINRADFLNYYAGSKKAVGIEVSQIHRLQYPVPLSVLGEHVRPPQSFQYVDSSLINTLRKYVPNSYTNVA